ncbi:MAG: LacI family DNA-binding transcriptional regulator [Azospirillaceae bacterium]|nr:LacI family DNA-binding transcriptional regulator [Azospirillaceae bacterium]
MKNADDSPDRGVRKSARLIDIARRADVSRATAARVLGGYSTVSLEAKKKVHEAAKELGYIANDLARSMRSGKTLTIGVVVIDTSNSFFASLVHAIIETAGAAGYQILLLNTGDELRREKKAVQVLLEKRVDGLIVAPTSATKTEHLKAVVRKGIPMVLLDRRVAELGIDSITTDDFVTATAATTLFARRGHRRVGLLVATTAADGFQPDLPADAVSTVRDRLNGGLAGLQRNGVEIRREWIMFSKAELPISTEAALKILSRDDRPTAILATNEEMALGCITACDMLNLSLGADVSLISFDDAPWAKVFRPALSVVRRPTFELGKSAATVLMDLIRGDKSPGSVTLAAELIDRQSVATCRPG